ncbi:putative LRR receptor-like serine/threonine-protein kinase [Dorcoceras hygrometricum]|uniref:non-specific serine/threonine protein kinase n=1 Tax=Dorcoceras hygrometricum TaxID=472368 RepID=A0A2Z7CNG5_9LAMI|nr:putative LRR receptor-like serine/threonine-protein kinase [Dorcoceras hygrometricum]
MIWLPLNFMVGVDTNHYRYTLIILLCLEARFISGQSNNLPEEEKNALLEIADQLGKKDWDFNLNPCDGNSNWTTPRRVDMPWYNNTVLCNCSYPDGACHVQKIFLKGQDLAGVLPPSLAKLTYLKTIDLTRNYLSGTIPPEWASTKLEYMSVIVNRLSGPIPKYLGDITTLVYMSLESNLFNGTVPAELGKLINLENLILSDNNLTGELPKELNNLSNLTELRLSSNGFTGKIPSFLSWPNLQKLEMQASGFEGPIHPSISVLKNLTELRISDLNGEASKFPSLGDMTGMNRFSALPFMEILIAYIPQKYQFKDKYLLYRMLRSCNLSGEILGDLKNMTALKTLDLSFNRLTGEIPDLEGLSNLQNTYLTQNFLTGTVPEWIKNRDTRYQYDLSYNNFTETSVPSTCRETLNLFRGYNEGKPLELDKCLRSFPCSKDWYSFHVNCGGGGIKIGDIFFEGDEESSGPAKFVQTRENWGTSSTGDFLGRNSSIGDYVANNISVLRVNDSGLYMTARLSPLSLTYYGRCLANGNYTVKLHFAEIVFRGNRSFQSLGRRMFDVYIQGEQKLKDFDIEKEANGVDKAVIQSFRTTVTDKTLEIRFHYSGKGSTAVPNRGSYGPMISAISVESDFKPPSKERKKILIGIGAALPALFLILAVIGLFWWKSRRNKISREKELRGLDLRAGFFTFKQIKAATDNFNSENKIGEGGFGSVYKGTLLDGTVIAVKQLSSKSKQGNREFVNEVGIISGLQHPNLVKLYGCCIEGNQLLLVYEYMENNNLARALYGPEECQLDMDFSTRRNICIGIAKGLVFLHDESTLKVVHRDIKATNVLLDKDLNPKISDFGLAKLEEDDNTHIITRVAGTIGYMAPEYALWGHLTYKADVYSFGVVTLELVAGINNTRFRPSDGYFCLLDWALVLQRRGNLMELVDPRLLPDLDVEEAEKMIRIALLCTSPSPALRPTMSEVVSMLLDYISVQEFNMDPSIHTSELEVYALREKYEYIDSSETVALVGSNVTARNASPTKTVSDRRSQN